MGKKEDLIKTAKNTEFSESMREMAKKQLKQQFGVDMYEKSGGGSKKQTGTKKKTGGGSKTKTAPKKKTGGGSKTKTRTKKKTGYGVKTEHAPTKKKKTGGGGKTKTRTKTKTGGSTAKKRSTSQQTRSFVNKRKKGANKQMYESAAAKEAVKKLTEMRDDGKSHNQTEVLKQARKINNERKQKPYFKDKINTSGRTLKPTPNNALRWAMNPGRYDLSGIDTKGKPKATMKARKVKKNKIQKLFGL